MRAAFVRQPPWGTGETAEKDHCVAYPPQPESATLDQPNVANCNSNDLSIIETSTNTVVGTIGGGPRPNSLAFTPNGGFAYVTNYFTNWVSVIDTGTGLIVATAGVGAGPNGVAVTPDTTPPTITVSASPTTLWPPNGRMVPVTISGTMTDTESGVNASTATYAVTDEYGAVQPSGPVPLGSDGSYVFVISLQASRQGKDKDGRHYTITISAQDNAGNEGSTFTVVTVPHD